MKSAVFLDRDGTIIEDVGYLDALERVSFYPWTIDAIRMLNRAGLPVVVVTNQSGIARGIFDAAFVAETHRLIDARLAAGGARIDAYYYCPHHPDGRRAEFARACDCRKPGPGMIEQAARELDLDPRRSFMVGDKWIDIGAGRAAGARAILVRTGVGAEEEQRPHEGLAADAVVDNLAAAVGWILEKSEV
jgi:D-glycero-D-manno-heptose 1,7-bisphosphate phosphatase